MGVEPNRRQFLASSLLKLVRKLGGNVLQRSFVEISDQRSRT